SILPSVDQLRILTSSSLLPSRRTSFPVATSHRRIALPKPPDANVLPSGDQPTITIDLGLKRMVPSPARAPSGSASPYRSLLIGVGSFEPKSSPPKETGMTPAEKAATSRRHKSMASLPVRVLPAVSGGLRCPTEAERRRFLGQQVLHFLACESTAHRYSVSKVRACFQRGDVPGLVDDSRCTRWLSHRAPCHFASLTSGVYRDGILSESNTSLARSLAFFWSSLE